MPYVDSPSMAEPIDLSKVSTPMGLAAKLIRSGINGTPYSIGRISYFDAPLNSGAIGCVLIHEARYNQAGSLEAENVAQLNVEEDGGIFEVAIQPRDSKRNDSLTLLLRDIELQSERNKTYRERFEKAYVGPETKPPKAALALRSPPGKAQTQTQ